MALTETERKQIKEATAIIERETANDGDALIIKGFGTFKRKMAAAKTGRNPKTGGTVAIPARSVLRFKPSRSQKFSD